MSFAPPPLPVIAATLPRGRVLVVAPHPDDEMVGPGGVLLRHAGQGDAISVVVVFDGSLGDPDGHFEAGGYAARRAEETRTILRDVVGCEDLVFFGFLDGVTEGNVDAIYPGLPTEPEAKRRVLIDGLAARIEAEIARVRPRVIYYPWIGEVHADHWGVAEATLQVARNRPDLVAGAALMGYEVWSTLLPETLVEITDVFGRKIAAIARYETQCRYVDLPTVVGGMNRYRAMLLPFDPARGPRFAEAFVGRYDPEVKP